MLVKGATGDTLCCHRTWSALVQVMTAPSNNLNWCTLIINKVLWCSPEENFTAKVHEIHPQYELKKLQIAHYCCISQGPTSCRETWGYTFYRLGAYFNHISISMYTIQTLCFLWFDASRFYQYLLLSLIKWNYFQVITWSAPVYSMCPHPSVCGLLML